MGGVKDPLNALKVSVPIAEIRKKSNALLLIEIAVAPAGIFNVRAGFQNTVIRKITLLMPA